MTSFPTAITRRLAGGAFAALLALGAATAHAQIVPKPAPPRPRQELPKDIAYYVDGKSVTEATVKQLKPDDIQAVNVLKGAQAQPLNLSSKQTGAVLVTTKAGANSPEVTAFNQRFPMTPATPEQEAAVAAVQSYIKQHYPAVKLESIFPAKGQTDRYTAIFEESGKRLQLLFDGKGNPVEQ
jgi:hypothetical protein